MNFFSKLWNPSGGLLYHLRARRYRTVLWREWIQSLEDWLCNEWNPIEKKIVIIGASAGHCLTETFLSRFDTIIGNDIDPLSFYFFKKNFPFLNSNPSKLIWDSTDYISPQKQIFSENGRISLKQKYPGHAILFSNVLGQLCLLDPVASRRMNFVLWKRSFDRIFMEQSIASYHDRFSAEEIEPSERILEWRPTQRVQTKDILKYYEENIFGSKKVELVDHETDWILEKTPRQYRIWEITPNHHHLIELVGRGPCDDKNLMNEPHEGF